MNSTTPQLTNAPPQSAVPRPLAPRRGSASPDCPTWVKLVYETVPIIGAALYGPPIIFVLGPWLLLVLLLIGPFALILTVLLVLAVVAGLLAAFVVVLASPYLLIRQLLRHGTTDAKPHAPLHLFKKFRVSSGRLGSLQPKGVS